MKKTITAMCLVSGTAMAGWGLNDLDPTNRNSGIRRTLRRADPHSFGRSQGKKAMNKIGQKVAENPEFRSKADREGWTINRCRVAGVGVATAIAGFQATAICAAYVAGEPISTTACVGLVIASGTTITEIACTQLCHDHVLRDCR